MKILHIDSSINHDVSISRHLSSVVVKQLTCSGKYSEVIYRDVVKNEIQHLTADIAAGFRPLSYTVAETAFDKSEQSLSQQLVTEFLDSDIIVIGAPMYNFSVPSQLKAWLDRIAQPGKTFNYTSSGPIGLAGGKKVIVVSARGGFYHHTPLQSMDFQENYLASFFGFLGISDIGFIRAEGASKGEEIKQQGISSAIASVNDTLQKFNLA
ncbi:FMN-dependent NADH-azoreductase [Kosakonia sacchari]|nr:FMN-dependent NADH-azoreductase [Kosakonia sacchari]